MIAIHPSRSARWILPTIIVLAAILRGLRLTWQPLWWDEGYSVYFATESLATMLRLTAQDIHPPLYYALLHGWLTLWGNASPLALRTFSVLIGVAALPAFWALSRRLFPGRARLTLLATLLLALSPMHIFYSQEVRMYGLELLLGLLSTAFFWGMVTTPDKGYTNHIGYGIITLALLYTEYYAVLLPLAHFVWALGYLRQRQGWLRLIAVNVTVAVAYLPWLLYAVPKLLPYVSQKIIADADRPLGLGRYLWQHGMAFVAGHLPAEAPLHWLQLSGMGGALFAVALGMIHAFMHRQPRASSIAHRPSSLLALCFLLPLTVGFFLNLRLPFFPEGGERVLLFVLPYFLLWLVVLIERHRLARLAFVGLILAATAGIWTFYTLPRYADNDYRELIRQTVQQGSDSDTVFAVFPWQVGYWRAYTPVWGRGAQVGPRPQLSPSPEWNGEVAAALDAALAAGKLWFPAHLALGGLLESEIERYLADHALNFDNRWYSPTTRLSAWQRAQICRSRAWAAPWTLAQCRSMPRAPRDRRNCPAITRSSLSISIGRLTNPTR